jgi:hypothetical protein
VTAPAADLVRTWEAVYAAAYVADVERLASEAQKASKSGPALEIALSLASAERAVLIADRAVSELAPWMRNG